MPVQNIQSVKDIAVRIFQYGLGIFQYKPSSQ